MSKAMLGVLPLSEIRGPVNDLIERLAGDEGRRWLEELKKFLRKEPCWPPGEESRFLGPLEAARLANAILNGPIGDDENAGLLELVSTVRVAATTSKFVAKENFLINTKRNDLVKLDLISDDFNVWFLKRDGKTEDPISEQTLRYHKLRQSCVDDSIIAELGGAEKSETTLSEMFFLMKKQKHGEDGVLLNNGWANIFYIKSRAGVLRAVSVLWLDGGWRVFARSVECPYGWCGGCQVFSRNSVLESSEPSTPAQA